MNIHYTCDTAELIKEREVLVKWSSNAFLKKVAVLFIVGLSLFIYGILNYHEYSKKMTSTHEGYSSKVQVHYTYTNWHLAESLGILILLVALYLFSSQKALKKYFQKRFGSEVLELENNNEFVEVKINESFVSVKKPSLFFEMQWQLFERYKEYDEYFFLLPKGNAFTAVIDKKKLTSSEIHFVFEQLKKHQIKR